MSTPAPAFRRFVADIEFFKSYVWGPKNLFTQSYKVCPAAFMRPGTYVAVCEPFIMDPASGEISYKWDGGHDEDMNWISGSSMGIKYARLFIKVIDLNHRFDEATKMHVMTWKIKIMNRSQLDEMQICLGE
jgi:hypothetical protein